MWEQAHRYCCVYPLMERQSLAPSLLLTISPWFTSPKIKVEILAAHSYLPLCDSMNCNQPDSPVHGFSRQEYWSGLPCPFPGDLPNPGIEPESPELWVDSLPSDTPGKPSYLLPSLINNCLNLPIGTQDLKVMEAE